MPVSRAVVVALPRFGATVPRGAGPRSPRWIPPPVARPPVPQELARPERLDHPPLTYVFCIVDISFHMVCKAT